MADELLDKSFDRELWRSGDDLVCVQRPRTRPVAIAALLLTFAGFAALFAIISVVIVFAAGERSWIVGALVAGALAAALGMHGFASLAADRAIRALPIREVPHVVISKSEVTFADGTRVPSRDVVLAVTQEDYGESDRYELALHAGDRRTLIMHAAREAGLDTARELLRRAGLTRYR